MRTLGFVVSAAFSCALFAASLQAQDHVRLTSQDEALLLHAARIYGFEYQQQPPWRLEAKFQVFDSSGNPGDNGTFEEIWESRTHYRQKYITSSFSLSLYGTTQGSLYVGGHALPEPVGVLRSIIENPLMDDATLKQYFTGKLGTIRADRKTVDGALRCFQVFPKGSSERSEELRPALTDCFHDDGTLASYNAGFFSSDIVTFTNPVSFQGHLFPGDLELIHNGVTILKAHLEELAPLTENDRSELVPPANAIAYSNAPTLPRAISSSGKITTSSAPPKRVPVSAGVAVGMLQSHHGPVYPAEAKAAGISGTVVLKATIGTDGRVKDLSIVQGPQELQQAALEAVQAWRYKPYLLNGEPVEVVTQINVVFTLTSR